MLAASEKNRLLSKFGPWALVTGASSGIGRALAETLAESGFNLVITARRKTLLEEMAIRYPEVKIRVVEADLATQAGIERVIEASSDVEVGLYIGSAGFGASGYFLDSDVEAEANMVRVNCLALMYLARHFAPIFTQRKKGGMILMSSIVSFQGVPFAAHYSATKAYVQSLAEALAIELKPHGISVLAPAPAPVHSGFAERANLKMDLALRASDLPEPILRALGRRSSVLPGLLSKALVISLRSAPRRLRIRIMQGIMKGMTSHQRV